MDKTHTISINPNRFISKGYTRSVFYSLNNELKLIPNDFISYLNNIIENKSIAKNEEYNQFIEKENFVCINAGVYKKIEYPTDLDVIEIHGTVKDFVFLKNLRAEIVTIILKAKFLLKKFVFLNYE